MHCISPPTETKVTLESRHTLDVRPAPVWAGAIAPARGQAGGAVALSHVPDCGCLGSVAKAMALAKPAESLGAAGMALPFPAHRYNCSAGG